MLSPCQSLSYVELVGDSEYKVVLLIPSMREAVKVSSIDHQGTDREKHGVSSRAVTLHPSTDRPYQFGLLITSFSTMVLALLWCSIR